MDAQWCAATSPKTVTDLCCTRQTQMPLQAPRRYRRALAEPLGWLHANAMAAPARGSQTRKKHRRGRQREADGVCRFSSETFYPECAAEMPCERLFQGCQKTPRRLERSRQCRGLRDTGNDAGERHAAHETPVLLDYVGFVPSLSLFIFLYNPGIETGKVERAPLETPQQLSLEMP